MITLITGVPGAGKSALAVHMMLEEVERGRELYVDGIKELQVPHEPMPPLAKWTEVDDDESTGEKVFVFSPPVGALIVIDEAQRIYRPRGVGAKVPDYVAALETHRRKGHDIWLVTQHPGLIDANVRKLCTRHIHLRTSFMGRRLHEWTEVGDVDSKSSRDLSAARKYKLPRRVFTLYKSAEVHTKVNRRVPVYAYVFVLGVVGALGAGYYVYSGVQTKLAPAATGKPVAPASSPGVGPAQPGTAPAAGVQHISRQQWAELQEPRVHTLAYTAPVYDGLTQPKQVPFPAACIKSASRCQCFTAQATRLEVDAGVCAQIVAEGHFNAALDTERMREGAEPPGAARERVKAAETAPDARTINPGNDQPEFQPSDPRAVSRVPSAGAPGSVPPRGPAPGSAAQGAASPVQSAQGLRPK